MTLAGAQGDLVEVTDIYRVVSDLRSRGLEFERFAISFLEPALACFGVTTRMSQLRNGDSLHLRRAVQIDWRVAT
jgi:hypothetical protein